MDLKTFYLPTEILTYFHIEYIVWSFLESIKDKHLVLQELQQKIKEVVDIGWGANANGSRASEMGDKMEKIRKAVVNFHGEMVLLINYSNINYTGKNDQEKSFISLKIKI